MLRFKQILLVISMVITWGATFLIALGSPTYKGKACIFFTGILINTFLGICYSYLKKRPGNFKEWVNM